jgi:hypothetical protein
MPILGEDEEQEAARRELDSKDARDEMRRAQKSVKRLRGFLMVVVAIRVFFLVLAIISVLAASTPLGGSLLPSLLQLGYLGFEVCLLLFVIHQLPHRPFAAALTLAVTSTLFLVLGLWGSGLEGTTLAIAAGIRAIWPIVFWIVTARAAALTRLADEHPDLFLSRRMRGERPRAGESGSVASRSLRRTKQDSRPPWIAMGIVAAAVVGVIAVALVNRPASPEETLDTIAAAWNARDFDTLADYAKGESREEWIDTMNDVPEFYGWGEAWPRADAYTWEVVDERVRAELQTEAGVVPFRLRWSKKEGWVLFAMSFRDVKDWKRD